MLQWLKSYFDLSGHETNLKREFMAGLISFFTIVYIIAVNASILAEAGIPLEAGIIATILTCVVGCWLMGIWANAPIILVPGMGINAMFTYTLVLSMGLSWQEALGVVVVSGIIVTIVSFTRLSQLLLEAIPHSLKHAITVGLGLFLTLIGLEKGGLIVKGESSLLALGDMTNPFVIATILSIIVTVILFIRNVPANFLISIIVGTVIAGLLGVVNFSDVGNSSISFESYASLFGAISFEKVGSFAFLVAVFSLTMVLLFENIGLINGHLNMINRPDKFKRSFQANGISILTSGLFGSSPTVSTVETAAGIAAGGRTGVTAIVTGSLFLLSILAIPFMAIIPGSAIAPILIIIGVLMLQSVKQIDFHDLSEGIPAFLVVVMIPFSYSIADGIAFGFIAYPLVKLAIGKAKEVPATLYIIAALFFLTFVAHVY
ncbi:MULTISPECIES: NCS2 family permease [Sutcliffiella]|uniref:NCS2 family permease n=1 Tax=Sutcliffiella TaxID=2837511 RepID=UPI0022DE6B16|nr:MULTISPECIES: NCS2 family permease [Sutcliffiella]MED4018325.1 NCS2 family permease [Sutcliffiella cohnii]WBL15596.1 NCS2 family permease [Sutcliffiella sp. NC1]